MDDTLLVYQSATMSITVEILKQTPYTSVASSQNT